VIASSVSLNQELMPCGFKLSQSDLESSSHSPLPQPLSVAVKVGSVAVGAVAHPVAAKAAAGAAAKPAADFRAAADFREEVGADLVVAVFLVVAWAAPAGAWVAVASIPSR
jgi:hypothetical protein